LDDQVRASAAAIAISQSRGSAVSALYDHKLREWVPLAAAVNGVAAICQISRTCCLRGDLPELHHSCDDAFVHLVRQTGDVYEGYDRATSTAFEVRVQGPDAAVYDHGAARWFSYSAAFHSRNADMARSENF
jgi:hypothetical protein